MVESQGGYQPAADDSPCDGRANDSVAIVQRTVNASFVSIPAKFCAEQGLPISLCRLRLYVLWITRSYPCRKCRQPFVSPSQILEDGCLSLYLRAHNAGPGLFLEGKCRVNLAVMPFCLGRMAIDRQQYPCRVVVVSTQYDRCAASHQLGENRVRIGYGRVIHDHHTNIFKR